MYKNQYNENNESSSYTYMQITNHYSTESTISPIQIRNCPPVLSPQLCYCSLLIFVSEILDVLQLHLLLCVLYSLFVFYYHFYNMNS